MPPDEQAPLLGNTSNIRLSLDEPQQVRLDESPASIADAVTKEDQSFTDSHIGERLPYNDYTTIDWLHDLVKDSYRMRSIRSHKGLRNRIYTVYDKCNGWIAVALIGSLTALVAFIVDICEATVSDWKLGYCTRNPLMDKKACCRDRTPLLIGSSSNVDGGPRTQNEDCVYFHQWSPNFWASFAIYAGFALMFGTIAAVATKFTRRALPQVGRLAKDSAAVTTGPIASGKFMYMAAGSGIPELKTLLSGFQIQHFLDIKVLLVKAFGAVFAVAAGMNLGKEGPFVHISGCVGYLVAKKIPKYANNERKMREIISASVSAGLSVAFGAPIGGVLFAYEEISTYFPRKVLWRAFLCSLFAAMVLKALNPNGTGKLVLFETNYNIRYLPYHYPLFAFLGIAGGLWGGMFCQLNYKWSKWFRSFKVIKASPVLEVALVVLATTLLQYPNPLTRDPGDLLIKNLLTDCRTDSSSDHLICQSEATSRSGPRWIYIAWLASGCVVKLILTTITFGIKVPSGVIIPALGAGALFGRLVGQLFMEDISPGILAMVGAGAFLAGVSRMTISLCVIMFELTGELDYVPCHMVAILVAKWVADALSTEGVYDLAQTVLGHPFLDSDHSMQLVQAQSTAHSVRMLVPPKQTMLEIMVEPSSDNTVPRATLERKLNQLKGRGLMDAGLVIVRHGMLQGYIGEGELEFGLSQMGEICSEFDRVRLLGDTIEDGMQRHTGHGNDVELQQDRLTTPGLASGSVLDLTAFVDRSPLSICETAPIEYAVECFGRLGLRHLMITEEGTGKLIGVCIKKRLLGYLESLQM